jgi:hypothetical protein
MPRRAYLLGVGLALVALAFALTGALLWEPGAKEANLGRVRVGMTLAEAGVIHGPEDDGATLYRWRGRAGDALAWTDDRGRVQQIFWSPFPAARRSFLARLRRRLGW